MKKKIWIFNHHANSMFFDNGGRHYCFAKYLKRQGYEPVIFCSNAVHGTGKLYFNDLGVWKEYVNEVIDVPFVFVNGRPYVGNGKDRILCMVDYYLNVKKAAKEFAMIYGKPDIIIGSQVHPLAVLAAEELAKKNKVKCIAEFRDLWPESFIEYGIVSGNSPLVAMLRQFEKKLYKKADIMLYTAENEYEYILERGWQNKIPRDKVKYINNGVDLEVFKYNRDNYQIDDEDLKNDEIFKVVYTGSIRRVNNLGLLLDTAKCVKNEKIRFLIWGTGDEVSFLKERVKDEKIANVVFKGHVEKKYVSYIVSQADLNIAHNNPSKMFRFGISFNKIFDYMAAGKPILCDFPCAYNPVVQEDAGVGVDNPTAKNIATVIEAFHDMDREEYKKYCDKAFKAAEKYDFKNLTVDLIKVIEEVME